MPGLDPLIDRRCSRRAFCRGAVACGVSAGFAGGLRPRSAGAKVDKVARYFDIHTHIGTVWNNGAPLSASELLRWMDAHDIEAAAVLPLVSPESSSYAITPDFVLAETAPYRDRLAPFCSIDPRTSVQGGTAGLVAMLKRYVDAGARGFGEHKPGVPIDDDRNRRLYAACAEVGLLVLFHLDNERNMDQPGLPGLARMLAEFTTVKFIGHGPGFWASISAGATQADLGGYPRGPIQPGGALDALMDKHPNLYGDLSAGSGAMAIRRDAAFGREFLIRRADRLMFGTDFLAPGQDVPQLDLYGRIDLPEDAAEKIYRTNARTILLQSVGS